MTLLAASLVVRPIITCTLFWLGAQRCGGLTNLDHVMEPELKLLLASKVV